LLWFYVAAKFWKQTMNFELQGKNLIFLISQPRAGSTLLQRILGGHPDIHTASEPWLMLHPLYALKPDGYQAEYNSHWACKAVQSFFQTLPGGKNEYIEGARLMYAYLYERALANSGKCYFLDKTPRYYFIISELYRIFPKAHYIILLRNPLAVLCSILNTWVKENWFSLYNYKHDLIQAPNLLLKEIEALGEQCVVVHYEKLVENPECEIKRICEKLGVPFVSEIIEYGSKDIPRWHYGDKKVYHYTQPASQNAEKWIQALSAPKVWRLANDYLQLLGKETIEQMGYSYEELQQIIEAHQPHWIRLWFTFSLVWLLKKPVEERKSWQRGIVRLIKSLRQRGIGGMLVSKIRKATNKLIHVL
jgi:hypothetical protein